MALPIAPFAGLALRYGAVAAAAFAASRTIPRLRRNQITEDTLDTVEEGIELRRDPEQINATARYCRIIRFGKSGPSFQIDATALTRIRFRRMP